MELGQSIENPVPKPSIFKRLKDVFGKKEFTFYDLVNFSNYDPEIGFYSGKRAEIELFGVDNKPLRYSQIPDYDSYIDKINLLHKKHRQAYKTPVEIHSPYYAIGMARYMEALMKLGNIEPVIYEIGAGRATLAKDMLDYWRRYNPDLYVKVKYRIIDASPKLITIQRNRLTEHKDKVEWVRGDARHLPFADKSLEGILVSTELLDNLPTACIKRKKVSRVKHQISLSDFVELGYRLKGDKLQEIEMSLSQTVKEYVQDNPQLLQPAQFRKAPLDLQRGARAYIGTGIREYYRELGRVFKKGYVISCDYATLPTQREEETYTQMDVHRGGGELEMMDNIGNADIYFSVDFESTNRIARKVGFQTLSFDQQKIFFRRLFEGPCSEDELKQLTLGDGFKRPIFQDYPNTFVIVHWVGLDNPSNYYNNKLNEVSQRHRNRNEDLSLGRE